MRIAPAELFAPRWTCFWATAYQFEPALFEQFLFRRLGDPPLNVTLLLDAEKLAETWARMVDSERWRLQRVGRHYLVRGVKLGSGSFHAKTYFFGNARDGLLLVGSGNLTLRGLEQGREVFSHFSSTDDQGLAVIRSWYRTAPRVDSGPALSLGRPCDLTKSLFMQWAPLNQGLIHNMHCCPSTSNC